MNTVKLGKCAADNCSTEFKRMGKGKIFGTYVSDPTLWGLAEGNKQLVVWLCSKCAKTCRVEFDRKHHQVRVVTFAKGSAAA